MKAKLELFAPGQYWVPVSKDLYYHMKAAARAPFSDRHRRRTADGFEIVLHEHTIEWLEALNKGSLADTLEFLFAGGHNEN